jgi:hypothetical protein
MEPIELVGDAFALGSDCDSTASGIRAIEDPLIDPIPSGELRAALSEIFADEEEERAMLPNFESVAKCSSARMRPPQLIQRILKTLAENADRHFVLLLLEPALAVEGVYALEAHGITKIWGDTPDEIIAEEAVRFWMYNGSTDQFVEQEEHSFSPFTDAISM